MKRLLPSIVLAVMMTACDLGSSTPSHQGVSVSSGLTHWSDDLTQLEGTYDADALVFDLNSQGFSFEELNGSIGTGIQGVSLGERTEEEFGVMSQGYVRLPGITFCDDLSRCHTLGKLTLSVDSANPEKFFLRTHILAFNHSSKEVASWLEVISIERAGVPRSISGIMVEGQSTLQPSIQAYGTLLRMTEDTVLGRVKETTRYF